MRFARIHGLGNDYLLLESGEGLTPALVRAICHRHTGLGSDGVLEPVPAELGARFGLRIHNPDGSEAEKSGNGLRIYAYWCAEGRDGAFEVWTPAGVVSCVVRGQEVTVAMGLAEVGEVTQIAGAPFYPVNVGNPHRVCFELRADRLRIAPEVEIAVPGRTNVQFAEVQDEHHVRVWIWERGAGHTLSSGSSACAVAAAGVHSGRLVSPVMVQMEGGDLHIEVSGDGRLTMKGPVERIATCELDADWLSRRTSHERNPRSARSP